MPRTNSQFAHFLVITSLWLMLAVQYAKANDGPCAPEWSALQGTEGVGTDAIVHALVVFDDGNGPALYIGGQFEHAGGVVVNGVAKWDGNEWSALIGDNGVPGVAGGVNAPREVWCMTIFDDGSGPALFVGGDFATAGGVQANDIAKWDGSNWSSIVSSNGQIGVGGPGSSDRVLALEVHDDGTGPALYAGGTMAGFGDWQRERVAKWNGSDWESLGTGLTGGYATGSVFALKSAAGTLYAGGDFGWAGSIEARRIAKWNGSNWSGMNTLDWPNSSGWRVYAIESHATDQGSDIYIAGEVGVRRWNGSDWISVKGGTHYDVKSISSDGEQSLYVVQGDVFRDDDGSWISLVSPNGQGLSGGVFTQEICGFDDGSGQAIYAGGLLQFAGGQPASNIARWGSPCINLPCPADVTGDNTINLADLNAVLADFGTDCP